jgi:phospholipid-binding lipoprotein MlaA
MLSAALAAMGPQPPATPAASLPITPLVWSLAQAEVPQDAGPDSGPQPDEGEEGNEIIIEGSYGPPRSDPVEQINAGLAARRAGQCGEKPW